MKPLDTTQPVQCRNGMKARVICTDRAGERQIIALIGVNEDVMTYSLSGRRYFDQEDPFDLINIPVQRTGWANVNKYGYGYVFPTKEVADRYEYDGRVACIEVSWTVGEGL